MAKPQHSKIMMALNLLSNYESSLHTKALVKVYIEFRQEYKFISSQSFVFSIHENQINRTSQTTRLHSKMCRRHTLRWLHTESREKTKTAQFETSESTSNRVPLELITYIVFNDKVRACQFEKYLKTGSGRAFLNKRLIDLN